MTKTCLVKKNTYSFFKASDHQVATTSTAPCRKQHLQGTQSFSHMPCSLCGSQRSPHSCKCQETGAESTQPSVIQERDYNNVDATDMGKERKCDIFLLFVGETIKKKHFKKNPDLKYCVLLMIISNFSQVFGAATEKWDATVSYEGQLLCPSSHSFCSPQKSHSISLNT